jgi:hypothetical protein
MENEKKKILGVNISVFVIASSNDVIASKTLLIRKARAFI